MSPSRIARNRGEIVPRKRAMRKRETKEDRLLARTVRAHDGTRPPGACPEADVLAAWTDGSLTAAERKAAEAHAADCDRCLAVLAAIAQTSPPPSTIEWPSWLSVRWLVPVATAVIAITTWAVVQSPPASVPQAPPPAAVASRNEATRAEPFVQAQPAPDAGGSASTDALAKKAEAPVARQLKDQADSVSSAGARPNAPSPAAAAPSRLEERVEEKDARLRLMAREVQPPRIIASPDPRIQWRVDGSSVERSIDGGRTWQAQPAGATADLLAGSSPGPGVCWIVGRKGTVLLSTDGETWRRLDFPDPAADLVGVAAPDGSTATVTTADGRVYRTPDAGRTWTLQEIPSTPF